MWYVYMIYKKKFIYTGITTNLQNRKRQHGNRELLFVEKHPSRDSAVKREKEIKGWRRAKKLALISNNKLPM